MLAETCIIYSWTLQNCLQMNALDFFRMHKEGLRLERERRAIVMNDLLFVSAFPHQPKEKMESIQRMFQEMAISDEEREQNFEFVEGVKRHTESLNKAPLDGEEARQAMMKVFTLHRRNKYGR